VADTYGEVLRVAIHRVLIRQPWWWYRSNELLADEIARSVAQALRDANYRVVPGD
jgi:hypothetical protein